MNHFVFAAVELMPSQPSSFVLPDTACADVTFPPAVSTFIAPLYR